MAKRGTVQPALIFTDSSGKVLEVSMLNMVLTVEDVGSLKNRSLITSACAENMLKIQEEIETSLEDQHVLHRDLTRARGVKIGRKKTQRDLFTDAMIDAFCEWSHIPKPATFTAAEAKLWVHPLWRIYDLFMPKDDGKVIYNEAALGNANGLIRDTVNEMSGKGLSISSPSSIYKSAVNIFRTEGWNSASGNPDFWNEYK